MKLPRELFCVWRRVLPHCQPFRSIARAQSYPDRPVKIVVPVAPSGSYEIVGRALADQLSKRLGQTVVVENRPGPERWSGRRRSSNRRRTVTRCCRWFEQIVFNVGLYNKPPYDPLKDLVPVAWSSTSPTP